MRNLRRLLKDWLFSIMGKLEKTFAEICAEPLAVVINALTQHQTVEQVFENLPDVEEITLNEVL